MVKSIGSNVKESCQMNIGTHNGIFHCDEIVGVAIFEIANMNNDIHVVRTRDCEVIEKLNIVIDVGGGKYDHHMSGFNECRITGEKYASAGLVWRDFADKAIKKIAKSEEIELGDEETTLIKEQIDQEVIIPVDMEDNGEKVSIHTFSFVNKFLPSWMGEQNYNCSFKKAEAVVVAILKEVIRDKIVKVVTKSELEKRYEGIEEGILEIPAQSMPWLEYVVEHNESKNDVKFVIFPYPAGGWAAQSVPPSLEKKFEQLIAFPKKWAGGNEETLPKLSGIADATFCHNGCFFVRSKSKESVIEMCKIAARLQ